MGLLLITPLARILGNFSLKIQVNEWKKAYFEAIVFTNPSNQFLT
jgi:hypothetical protein